MPDYYPVGQPTPHESAFGVGDAFSVALFSGGGFAIGWGLWCALVLGVYDGLLNIARAEEVPMVGEGFIAFILMVATVVVIAVVICVTILKLKQLEIAAKRQERLDALDRDIALKQLGGTTSREPGSEDDARRARERAYPYR